MLASCAHVFGKLTPPHLTSHTNHFGIEADRFAILTLRLSMYILVFGSIALHVCQSILLLVDPGNAWLIPSWRPGEPRCIVLPSQSSCDAADHDGSLPLPVPSRLSAASSCDTGWHLRALKHGLPDL